MLVRIKSIDSNQASNVEIRLRADRYLKYHCQPFSDVHGWYARPGSGCDAIAQIKKAINDLHLRVEVVGKEGDVTFVSIS